MIAWLWARTVTCPESGGADATMPLDDNSFELSKKKGREYWATQPVIEGKTVRFEVTQGLPPKDSDGTVKRTGGKCIVSGEPMAFDYIRAEGKAGRLGAQLMAIVTEGKRGRSYYSPADEHAQIADSAEPKWKPVGNVPEQALGFRVQLYGMDEYHKLFTPRQLTALTTFSDLVHEARELATENALEAGLVDDDVPLREGGRGARAYGEAVSVYLAFAVSRETDFMSTITRWLSSNEQVKNIFARQAIAMLWDYAEVNPMSGLSGSWMSLLGWVIKGLENLATIKEGLARQADAATLDDDSKMLSTDPPYYGNIGYADLSDFFYVWQRRILRDVYPDVFTTVLVPKFAELIASSYRHGGKDAAKKFFESGMRATFTNFSEHVRQDFPTTVYYAFKQQDAGFLKDGEQNEVASTGWETMLISMIAAGFSIVGTWPIRTESSIRLNALGANALASSIVLVCRPRPEDAPATSRRRFQDELRAQLPAAILQMRTGKILPVDLAQASIGPGMAIYSRYSRVLEANGDPVSVRQALSLINNVLAETLYEFVGEVDEYTRFAIDWFQQHQFEAGDAGSAETLAMAKNTSLPGLERAGLIELGGGEVRLLHWQEYDPGAYDPRRDDRRTVWEGTHHLIERLNTYGETGAATLLTRMSPELAGAAQDLAFSLYDICDRNGWARHARDYNGLIASWQGSDGIASEAARLGREPGQGALPIDVD